MTDPLREEKAETKLLADDSEVPNEPPDAKHLEDIKKIRIARMIEEGLA